MTDYPKFVKMQKMFHGKSMAIIEVQPIVETQIVTTNVNVLDVNVTTRSKTTEKHVFKDKELRKANNVDWEKEEQLEKSMLEIIQHI
jgi:succinyl-CoA synthetase beta subunit